VTPTEVTSTPALPDPALPDPALPDLSRVRFRALATLLSRAVGTPVDNSTVAKLVELLIGTWPTGPKGHVWTRVLTSYDQPAAAHQAWRNLARTEERMTVAAFDGEYRRLTAVAAERLGGCDRCDGHGWRPIRVELHSHVYDAVEACNCPAGRAHTDTARAIAQANDNELNRIIPGRITRPTQETLDANF
jgi:hypothetical protein